MTNGEKPPDTSRVLELDGGVADITAIRRWALSALSTLHDDDALDVVLVITELVSNVYDHGRFPAQLHLYEWARPHVVGIEVDDSSSKRPVLRPWSADSGRGRGLILVDELAQRWGVVRRALGKSVWALVPCPGTV
ncbi:ATPase [Lentzea pudingi]|uniref:ATPase n=1 Tax=Lentzea pudingi TaxID=1789439 RepID=A0ABQ2HQF6_9PSEU|nr:ATP-binding protein [Lentzea pudingi]GGM86926.1 ATPase [Lentzea pudingi]